MGGEGGRGREASEDKVVERKGVEREVEERLREVEERKTVERTEEVARKGVGGIRRRGRRQASDTRWLLKLLKLNKLSVQQVQREYSTACGGKRAGEI